MQTLVTASSSHVGAHPGLTVGGCEFTLAAFSGRRLKHQQSSISFRLCITFFTKTHLNLNLCKRTFVNTKLKLFEPIENADQLTGLLFFCFHLNVDLIPQHSCSEDHGFGSSLELFAHVERFLERGAPLVHVSRVQDLEAHRHLGWC